ncbi:UDP-3-O-[3-hydroxymyristoyl] glucosamine N-acyltransferase [Bathymodiolus japonicus methanotrophic gill symbiont]|uniref:UDP-3-O-(3-hydroxymyristoyl)glucosamine N-acyltransferase n=1 Tax=Bathymodiolus japonicus methanotrophic gill symbiont TaxID=113269 RepID=UPI001B5F217F|nr:UDP-3-O-(3-hydroxymyristoyl)glucosamine N-acyltransferase [Bathymodiolus japonicus methanotrophic gill symbiont]GFO72637.1 UDP-3-O-[3-hydroxymyristoyl] glucosamine N-acyltransferase [Bathymodiolus japonicus methanotrophic gill symbiont]
MQMRLADIQQHVGGEMAGDTNVVVTAVNSLELAVSGEIAYAENDKYLAIAKQSNASIIIVPKGFPELAGKNILKVDKPKETFIGIMMMFDDAGVAFSGIHPSAVIAEKQVNIARSVAIAAHVCIQENVTIGANTSIDSNTHIAHDVVIGEHCKIGPNVSILSKVTLGHNVTIHAGTVIGGEGFGYFWDGQQQKRVPQLGVVIIEDNVEIGCNTCIDRATFGMTRIGKGTKIDNLVQIAHNNDIGEHCIIVSHVGLSGSVTLGKRVTLAGQVGIADHITMGDGSTAAARTGISKDVKPNQIVWGAPNRPIKQVMREMASIPKLPALLGQVKNILKRLTDVEQKLSRLGKE